MSNGMGAGGPMWDTPQIAHPAQQARAEVPIMEPR